MQREVLVAGTRVGGRFRVEERAGAGGMGTVYRAIDEQTGAPVALKLLDAPALYEARMAREAAVLASLEHPAIVRYVDHGTGDDGRRFIAMEWLDGVDLDARLARGALGLGEALALARRVASALAAAHARGVIHRDIKPSNVFLPGGRVEEAKVVDFGIARVLRSSVALTRPGAMLGTPGYMAPEQARGEAVLDGRVDVFALGCVLFEALTGRAAFAGENALAVLAKVLLDDAPRLREHLAEAPAALEALLARMMARDPAERPADCAELRAALDLVNEREIPNDAPPRAAVGVGERRLFSVVLASRGSFGPVSMAETLAPSSPDELAAVGAAMERFRVEPLHLADGSYVLPLGGAATARDQAAMAARCALALQKTLPGARVVVATGRAEVSGRVPIGEVIDRAARLAARPESKEHVLLDAVTRRLLDGRFSAAPAGDAFVLQAVLEAGATARTLLGVETRCVGRERELGALIGAFDDAAGEQGARAALLTGVPGVGKSRVASEFVARLLARPAPPRVWIARADALRGASPLAMIADLVRHAAALAPSEGDAEHRDRLRTLAERSVAPDHAPRVAAFLGEIVGVSFEERGVPELSVAHRNAIVMGAQRERAVLEWLRGECARSPVVLVLEDLHWGDVATVKLLHEALRTLQDRALFVLAVARPEVHGLFPSLWHGAEVHEVALPGLSKRAAELLAAEALGAAVDATRVRSIVEQAGGNALYLEELVRHVAESDGGTLPETLVAMMQLRLEALDAESRRVLRAACVFGETFWLGGVRALLADAEGPWLAQRVSALAENEYVQPLEDSRFAGEREFRFRHALAREAAYAMLTEADRFEAHRAAGAWLAAAGEHDALVLAEHFERGDDGARAAPWFLRAAELAIEQDASKLAEEYATRGLRHARDRALSGSLHAVRGLARGWQGDWHAAAGDSLRGIELLAAGSAQRQFMLGAAVMFTSDLGRFGESRELRSALLREEFREQLSPVDAMGWAMAGRTLLFEGQYSEARWVLDKFVVYESGEGPRDNLALGWGRWVRSLESMIAQADPWGVRTHARAAATYFERIGEHHARLLCAGFEGLALLALGRSDEAVALLERASAEAVRRGNPYAEYNCRGNLAFALAAAGRAHDAIEHFTAAREGFARGGNGLQEAQLCTALAGFYLAAGDLETARSEIDRVFALLPTKSPMCAPALATSAQIARREGDIARALEAADALGRSFELYGAVGMNESSMQLARVEVLDAAGHLTEADGVLARSRARLLERAARIDDPSYRDSFLTGVRKNARLLSLAEARLGPAADPASAT